MGAVPHTTSRTRTDQAISIESEFQSAGRVIRVKVDFDRRASRATTTPCLRELLVPALEMIGEQLVVALPGSATTANARHSVACARRSPCPSHQHGSPCTPWTIGTPARQPAGGAKVLLQARRTLRIDRMPASSALLSVGDANGSTPTTLTRSGIPGGDAAIRPLLPTDTEPYRYPEPVGELQPERSLSHDGWS